MKCLDCNNNVRGQWITLCVKCYNRIKDERSRMAQKLFEKGVKSW